MIFNEFKGLTLNTVTGCDDYFGRNERSTWKIISFLIILIKFEYVFATYHK